MKQKKPSSLTRILGYAGGHKNLTILGCILSALSAVLGLAPYLCVWLVARSVLSTWPGLDGAGNLGLWGWMAVWTAVGSILLYFAALMSTHIAAFRTARNIRRAAMTHVLKLPLGFFAGNQSGRLRKLIEDNSGLTEDLLAHKLPDLAATAVTPIAAIVVLFLFDWRMGLLCLLTMVLALLSMCMMMGGKNAGFFHRYQQEIERMSGEAVEYVRGIPVVKMQSGNITPAELAMGIILSLSIVGPLMKATTFINEAKSMEYAVEAANEILNLPILPDAGKIVPTEHTDIVLQNVSFSYDSTEQNEVLHDISLKMPQGSFTALVGPSGGGKSTVARLIARFWDVTGGSISIGGTNIKELSIRQLSELVSFVTQDNFLFNCSLKENIRLGNPNATDEEVYAAAKAACCDDFIVRLEKGYDTPAGDAGKRLSGGEKQRIAIARAILKNAPIVILDEATAFTDPQNEDKIQKSIMALSKGKTLLVIAHRLSTIQNADQIVVLKKGQIVDCGKQDELLERCPLYADMWQAHIGAKNWSVGERKEVAVNV